MKRHITYLLVLFFSLLALQVSGQQEALDSSFVDEVIFQVKDNFTLEENATQMEQALYVAQSIKYAKGEKEILAWLATYHERRKDNITALRFNLALLDKEEKDQTNNTILNTLLKIAEIYAVENLGDKALEYYRKALHLSEDKAALWNNMGSTFLQEQEADSAQFYFTKVYEFAKVNRNYELHLNALQNKIIAGQQKNQHREVLKYNLEILKLIENKNDGDLMAISYNNIGYNYHELKEYENAILYFEKAEALNQETNSLDESIIYTNLGIAYQNSGDLQKAIEQFTKARQLLFKSKNKERFAQLTHLMSSVYYKNNDLFNAQTFNDEAINTALRNQNKRVLSESYFIGASIHQDLYDYEKALTYYKQHLALRDSFLLEERLKQQALLQQQYLLERAEKEIKILISNQEIQTLNLNQLSLEKDKLELSESALRLEGEKRESELVLLKQEQEIREASLKNKELEALKTQQTLLLTTQQLSSEKQDREIAELNRKEAEQSLALANKTAEEKERLKEIDLLNKDKQLLTRKQEIAQLEIDKQSAFKQLAYGFGVLGTVILGLIFAGLLFARRSNKNLEQKNLEIEKERSKSDALLLNILPTETANELKEVGIATPKKYELVSVLFTDFSGFTAITKNMSPEQLIKELNECFIAFDEIAEQFGLEKIKTIGDAYMCAGGLPVANKTNPIDVVKAAKEMSNFMNRRLSFKQAKKENYWNMRIGIHSGEVIAGVVGKKKFAYDIWGDTVNIASRMESSGKEGSINISSTTYAYIKDHFKCTYRGAIEIKNGGKVEMYFVD